MRRRPHWLLVALPILTGAALVAWLSGAPRGASEPSEVSDAGSGSPGAPLLAANDAEAAEGYRIEEGVAVPKEGVSDATGPGVLVLRVVDETDRPVPDRIVVATLAGWTRGPGRRRSTASTPRRPLRTRRTDASGLARWVGLPDDGAVEVDVVPDDRWSGGSRVAFVGQPIETVRIWEIATVPIRVTDGDGRGVPQARVMLYAPAAAGTEAALRSNPGRAGRHPPWGDVIAGATADDAGRASLRLRTEIAGGRLWVGAEGFAPWVDLAWTARETDVRVEPAREIEGIVKDTRGAVVADGVVQWQAPQGIHGEEPVAYDGTFAIGGLPSSRVRLEWRLPDAPALDGRNVQHVTPGGGTVTFVVTLGADLAVRIVGWPRQPGGEAFLTPQDDTRPDPPRLRAEIDLDGNARFQGMVSDRPYVLWVPPRSGTSWEEERRPAMDGIVYRKDVVAAPEPLVVALDAGRRIRGVIDVTGTDATWAAGSEEAWREASVSVRGAGMELRGACAEAPTDAREIPFEVAGVPHGAFTIVATVRVEHGERPSSLWTGDAPVATSDEPLRIRLRPAPPQGGENR